MELTEAQENALEAVAQGKVCWDRMEARYRNVARVQSRTVASLVSKRLVEIKDPYPYYQIVYLTKDGLKVLEKLPR